MNTTNPYADLEAFGDFDAELATPAPARRDVVQPALERGGLEEAPIEYSRATGTSTTAMREKIQCDKCRGTGRFISYSGRDCGECFTCKGQGYQMRAAGYTERKAKQALKKIEQRKAEADAKAEAIHAFRESHPDVFAALNEYGLQDRYRSEFMDSLTRQLAERGTLTEGQIAAVRRGIEKRNAAKAEKAGEPVTLLPRIYGYVAVDNRKLILGDFKVVMFQSGAVAVVGKQFGTGTKGIIDPDGSLRRFAKMTDAELETLKDVELRGLEAVKEIGLATGTCCCCGRTLTDEYSIQNGIGPVCAKKAAGF
jgi:hypothetical protein